MTMPQEGLNDIAICYLLKTVWLDMSCIEKNLLRYCNDPSPKITVFITFNA